MMGVGKSTIGRVLAKRLKLEFIDIDNIIEIKEKNNIKEIFENKGEEYFRKVEKKISIEEIKKQNLVIALGGGAFLDPLIRKEVKNSCISFWLDLSIKLLLPRLKNNTKRPLLDHRKLEQSVNKIYSLRKKIYNESSFKIKCDILDKDAIVNKIINLYEISRDKI
jgi:shikimate kinase